VVSSGSVYLRNRGVLGAVGDLRPRSLTDARSTAASDRVVAVNHAATCGVGSYGREGAAMHAGGIMRQSSSRAATAAALVAGLGLVGKLS
jgi:hypothetical protein